MSTGPPYTEADDALILDLSRSPAEIARLLGRSLNAINSRRHRLRRDSRDPGRAANGQMRLPRGRARWLLAKSCAYCGELLPPTAFPKGKSGYHKSYCKRCESEVNMDRRLTDEVYADRFYRYSLERHQEEQRLAKAKASNQRKEWTGPELELVMRRDLTDRQKAEILGRTFYAVRHIIRKVNAGDPKKVNLAGLSREDS